MSRKYIFKEIMYVSHFAGFIAGVKMMLSPDVKRTDNKMCEEVDIPVSEAAPLSVGKKLVPISSLDEVRNFIYQFKLIT